MTREEWLLWRKQGIGSSDAPIIMGTSKWRTRLELYEEKVSTELVDNPPSWIQQKGIDMEPRIRSLVEVLHGKSYKPETVVVEQIPYLRASLDGRSVDCDEIIELKYCNKKDWEYSKETKKVPDCYFPQCQHGLMVESRAKVCYYGAYLYSKTPPQVLDPDDLVIIPVLPDKEYQARLFAEETKFWEEHVMKRIPPEDTDDDYTPLVGVGDIAIRYKKLDAEIKALTKLKEEARALIEAAADGAGIPRLLVGGIKLRQKYRKGTIDYDKIPELKGVDLEPHRKEGKFYWEFDTK